MAPVQPGVFRGPHQSPSCRLRTSIGVGTTRRRREQLVLERSESGSESLQADMEVKVENVDDNLATDIVESGGADRGECVHRGNGTEEPPRYTAVPALGESTVIAATRRRTETPGDDGEEDERQPRPRYRKNSCGQVKEQKATPSIEEDTIIGMDRRRPSINGNGWKDTEVEGSHEPAKQEETTTLTRAINVIEATRRRKEPPRPEHERGRRSPSGQRNPSRGTRARANAIVHSTEFSPFDFDAPAGGPVIRIGINSDTEENILKIVIAIVVIVMWLAWTGFLTEFWIEFMN